MSYSFLQIAQFFLLIGVALFWTITYLLIIIKSAKDQFCGMPLASICANITWEFLFTFVMPFHLLQQIVTLIWFLLDCVILYQYIRYSKNKTPKPNVYSIVLSLLIIFLLLHYGSALEFHDQMGVYSAFAINLLMSVLFIKLIMTKGMNGQSLPIAYFKMIGTLCASVVCYAIYPDSILLNIFYILIFVADAAYVVLVTKQSVPISPSTSSALDNKSMS